MLRAIREIQPTWVVGENVFGLINWNDALVFDEVQADLEAKGYEVQPYVLPACSVNAPHRRDRVWFVAYRNFGSKKSPGKGSEAKIDGSENNDEQKSGRVEGKFNFGRSEFLRHKTKTTPHSDSDGHELRGFGENRPKEGAGKTNEQERERVWNYDRGVGEQGNAADTDNKRREGFQFNGALDAGQRSCKSHESVAEFHQGYNWKHFPTQSPVCNGDDGLSARLDGITFSKWRNESIKAGGNAVVPQVVLQIFKAIEQYNNIRP